MNLCRDDDHFILKRTQFHGWWAWVKWIISSWVDWADMHTWITFFTSRNHLSMDCKSFNRERGRERERARNLWVPIEAANELRKNIQHAFCSLHSSVFTRKTNLNSYRNKHAVWCDAKVEREKKKHSNSEWNCPASDGRWVTEKPIAANLWFKQISRFVSIERYARFDEKFLQQLFTGIFSDAHI